jgi:aminopeptidase N
VSGTIVTGLIGSVASSGERPDLAWDFLQKNYDALLAKQGPQFRDQFIANFMTNFSDERHAVELAAFAPAQATSGGRMMAVRAQEVIAISADLKARALPAVDTWIKARK